MAIQGADYEREQMAFKGETRSKRGTEHKPWHTAFWFGIAYDASRISAGPSPGRWRFGPPRGSPSPRSMPGTRALAFRNGLGLRG